MPQQIEHQADESWLNRAACATVEARRLNWFPDDRAEASDGVQALRAICAGCPVIGECEAYYERHEPHRHKVHGFAYGKTATERRRDKGR